MKFCFVASVSATLRGKAIGGAELQITLLAKALAGKGHDVVIVDYEADEAFVTEEGVKVIPVPEWHTGIKGLRLFTRQLPALYRALIAQKADFYYVRMRAIFNIVPYLAARKNKAKFIVALAHDLDVAGFRERFRHEYRQKFSLIKFLTLYLPNDLVFDYTIRRADYVTLQHKGQYLRSRRFKGKQAVFRNIFDYREMKTPQVIPGDFFVLAGSLTMLKGIGNLLELVKKMKPAVKLIVIGEPRGEKAESVYRQLSQFPNVELKGRLPHADTINHIASAKALVSTSNFEGFPNIFLEAWACGVPVISLHVNPGDVINEFSLGKFFNGDYTAMAECINTNGTGEINSAQLKAYISNYHDFERAADRFIHFLN